MCFQVLRSKNDCSQDDNMTMAYTDADIEMLTKSALSAMTVLSVDPDIGGMGTRENLSEFRCDSQFDLAPLRSAVLARVRERIVRERVQERGYGMMTDLTIRRDSSQDQSAKCFVKVHVWSGRGPPPVTCHF